MYSYVNVDDVSDTFVRVDGFLAGVISKSKSLYKSV